MEKCASFSRKASPFAKIGSAANDSCPVRYETGFVAGGLYLNMLNEGPALVRRSEMIPEGPCNDMHLPVQCSTVELDPSNCNNGEPNCRKSPRTVFDTSFTDFDAISCRPHGYLSPQLQLLPCCSDWDFSDPSKFLATGNDYGFSPYAIHNSRADFSREASMEASPSCSESEDLNLNGLKEEIKNLRALGASEPTLSYMEERKRSHSMIYNRSCEIQKETSESFEALHILANMAIWVLDNIDHRAKASSEHWGIFHPAGVLFRQKRVIRRAKNAFKSLSGLHCNANNKVAANSELFSGSLGFIQPSENQVSDKDEGTIQSGRSSKRRRRSQFLSSKYCDSVLF